LFQLELITAVKNKAQRDSRIDAVMMYGSFTQNCGDAFSDVEFYVFVNDESFKVFNAADWIFQIHPYELHFFNEYGTEVVIFDNLVRGEFHFLPKKEMAIIETFKTVGHFPDIDSMCLCDKDGSLRKYLQICADYEINRYSKESIEFTANNLINMVIYGINVFKRGEFARSVECLSQSQKYYLQLIRLKENCTDHWVNPTKCLEKEISIQSYHKYSDCYANVEPENILRAYENLIANTQSVLRPFVYQYDINDYNTLLNSLNKYLKKQ
jgi:lincosamide nucleotidyltransferase